VKDRHQDPPRDGNAISSFNDVLDRMWGRFGRQLRHPTGVLGSLAGWFMAIINDRPNRLAIDALAPGPNDRVLELGFGPGWALRTIAARAPGGQFFGIDQSDRMLEQAANINQAAIAAGRMQLVKGQFHPLPWIDGTFNKILLVNVAYFFGSDGNDAAEVFRVLKPGGRLVVYVTARETMEKWPFAGPDTHRTYDSNDLRNLLENAGFQRSEIRIQTLTLPFGICGLLATAEKSNARLSVSAEGHPMIILNTETIMQLDCRTLPFAPGRIR
jgi:SAM-dependent methyltransferase